MQTAPKKYPLQGRKAGIFDRIPGRIERVPLSRRQKREVRLKGLSDSEESSVKSGQFAELEEEEISINQLI
jgi:hypothetical protein